MDLAGLAKELKRGDRGAMARCITIAEDDPELFAKIIKGIYNPKKMPRVLGITGPPGCGKSTLISKLAPRLAKAGHRLGIIAIDASSPFTGGAFLGNRIRMEQTVATSNIFMRSIATRGTKGGLTTSVMNAIITLSCAGYDLVIVESVGAGQSDIDILNISSTVLLVLAPGLGDEIQAMKAGSMEIADIFVVNKADLQGADEAKRVINVYLHTFRKHNGKRAVSTSCTTGQGIDELVESITGHEKTVNAQDFMARAFRLEVDRIAKEIISKRVDELSDESRGEVDRLLENGTDPYSAALALLKKIRKMNAAKE